MQLCQYIYIYVLNTLTKRFVLFKCKEFDIEYETKRAVRRSNIADVYTYILSRIIAIIDQQFLMWFKYSGKSIVSILLTFQRNILA